MGVSCDCELYTVPDHVSLTMVYSPEPYDKCANPPNEQNEKYLEKESLRLPNTIYFLSSMWLMQVM